MAIRIVRNEQGNCINFYGSSNPTYWNSCLSGEVDSTINTTVNVVNDIITSQTGTTQYEFFRVPYTDFVDSEGNGFASAQEAADYITEKANVVGLGGGGTDLTDQDVCFKLDDTSTSIMLDNGYSYGVNTIKAVNVGDGLITIQSELGDIVHFTKLDHTNVCDGEGASISGGLNDVINYLNELFTVGAFESVVISDPYSTMIADVSGVDTSISYVGYGLDPIGDDIYGSTNSNSQNGLLTTETIDQAGEYFTFDIRVEGTIGFGLVHTQDSYDAGYYSGNSTYANPTTFGVSNSGHSGYQFSHWFHPTPNGSWTNYGANTSYSMRAGWSNFSGTDEQADWLAGNPIKVRVGIDNNSYISIETLRNGSEWVVHSRTSYPIQQGAEFKLGIKTNHTGARVFSLPKVHLLEPVAPTMYFRYIESPDGVFNYPLFATSEEAEYYDEIHNGLPEGTGSSHTHVYVDDATNTTWYMPEASHDPTSQQFSSAPSNETFNGQPANYTEITSLTDSDFAPSPFVLYQQYMMEGGTINYQLSPQDVDYTTTISGQPVWMSLSGGYLLTGTANYVSANTDYIIDVTRTNSYGSTTSQLTVTVQDDIVASQLSGITTAYGNTLNPNHVFQTEGFAGKLNTTISQGQEISWTHRDFTVGGFLTAGAISNFNNGVDIEHAVNWDLRFSTWSSALMQTFSKGWAVGGSQSVGNLDGATHKMVYKNDGYVEYYLNDVLKYTSADAYTGDKDLYLMTPDTYNLNTELPVDFSIVTTGAGSTTAPSGFNSPLLQGEMGATGVLGNGADAAAASIFTINSGNRLIITQEWIESNVLPYMDSDDDKVFLGIPKTTATYNSITLDDFDMVIRLQKSGNGVKSLIWDNGANDNEVTVNSLSDAFYNYAFEWDGTDLSLIAHSTYGDFSTIHSVADGGVFNRSITHSGFTQQSGNLPFVIATNDNGQVKLNPSFVAMSIPATPTTNLTPWTKALDFSGSNEHLLKVNNWNGSNPLLMDSISQVLASPTTSGNTANASNARPWATAIVFKADGNSSNQHIWNSGEGAGSTDDNIYLRLSASRELIFGWGRSGAVNECIINNYIPLTQWIGIYVAHNGTRLSGSDATAANLADAFDIRMCTDGDWTNISQKSTSTNWTNGSTGGRMDRGFTGNFTIGGRGSNRNFHGKVASMVVTTLKLGVAMPTSAEIELMITDPKKWEDDYRVGQTVRRSQGASNVSYANSSVFNGHGGTQIWLMGDGTLDSYANGIRNQVYAADQNYGKLQLNSMVSNDIQTVNINGLT